MGTEPSQQPPAGAGRFEQAIRTRIETLSYLPTTVAVAMKFIELGKDPDAEPSEYSKVIASDSSLSAKLLSLANSSWFGVRHKVTKVHTAVSLLGLSTVRTLAISYCVTGLHNELRLDAKESSMFWAASLSKAVAAKQYAALHDPKAAEEAFAAGLFQDFAVPVMYATAKDEVLALLQDPGLDAAARLQRERALFRLDHTELARSLAQKLELPDLFVDAVAFHHQHASLRQFLERPVLADAAYVASLFPHLLVNWNRQDAEELRRFLGEHTQTTPEDFLAGVQQEYGQLRRYFETDTAETKLADLLAAASSEIADHTTRLVGTVQDLLQQVAGAGQAVEQFHQAQTEAEDQAARDPLTGALNRAGFTARATDVVAKACRYGTAFALAYLDLDRFKAVNDTLGHACGDETLKMLVASIQRHTRQNDLLGRLGGDEFVVLLPDCGQDGAVQVVERILATVAAPPLPGSDHAPAPVTASGGLVWVQGRDQQCSLEQLLTLADALMYEAKRAGVNRLAWRHVQPAAPAAA